MIKKRRLRLLALLCLSLCALVFSVWKSNSIPTLPKETSVLKSGDVQEVFSPFSPDAVYRVKKPKTQKPKTQIPKTTEKKKSEDVAGRIIETTPANPGKIGEWIESMRYYAPTDSYYTVYYRITSILRGDEETTEVITRYNNAGHYCGIPKLEDENLEYCVFYYEVMFPQKYPEDPVTGIINCNLNFKVVSTKDTEILYAEEKSGEEAPGEEGDAEAVVEATEVAEETSEKAEAAETFKKEESVGNEASSSNEGYGKNASNTENDEGFSEGDRDQTVAGVNEASQNSRNLSTVKDISRKPAFGTIHPGGTYKDGVAVYVIPKNLEDYEIATIYYLSGTKFTSYVKGL